MCVRVCMYVLRRDTHVSVGVFMDVFSDICVTDSTMRGGILYTTCVVLLLGLGSLLSMNFLFCSCGLVWCVRIRIFAFMCVCVCVCVCVCILCAVSNHGISEKGFGRCETFQRR